MKQTQRVALWIQPGLTNALAARAALGAIQVQFPSDSQWVLLGPEESVFLFEMDQRINSYIPMRMMGPRRAAQSVLGRFFESRAEYAALKQLKLDQCIGVMAQPNPEGNIVQAQKAFQKLLRKLDVPGFLIEKELDCFLTERRPPLQAGANALAFATQLHRKSPPHLPKYLVLLGGQGQERPHELDQQWKHVQDSGVLKSGAQLTVAVIEPCSRLVTRHLAEFHPGWLVVNMAEALGCIAYADQVICFSGDVTRLCLEMERSAPCMLGKSNS